MQGRLQCYPRVGLSALAKANDHDSAVSSDILSDEMTEIFPRPKRAKIGSTIDAGLLRALDNFVAQHPELDRSKVIDEALRLWLAREQAKAMAEQFRGPRSTAEQEEQRAWHDIQTASARRILRSP